MVTYTTSLLTKHTQSVCLVHHDGCVVLVLQSYYLGQVAQVAFHGEYAIHNYQFHFIGLATLQYALQIGHVIVLIVKLGGETQAATIDDACMVAVITDDIVILAYQLRYHTTIDSKSCRKDQSIVLAHKLGQFLL